MNPIPYKFYRLFIFSSLILSTFSCSKKDGLDNKTADDSFKITAKDIINSTNKVFETKVSEVRGVITLKNNTTNTIAKTLYHGNEFTIALPKAPAAQFLETFWGNDVDFAGLTMSDKTTKTIIFSNLLAYNKIDNKLGYFFLESKQNNIWYYTFWMYADRDVSINGTANWNGLQNYNLILKKGWNEFYGIYEGSSQTFTSTKPSASSFSWVFYDLNSYNSKGNSIIR